MGCGGGCGDDVDDFMMKQECETQGEGEGQRDY